MHQVASSSLRYHEDFIPNVPGLQEPSSLLKAFLDNKLASNYILYRDEANVRIALNSLAEVWVTPQNISTRYQEHIITEPITDPLKQVEVALAALPLESWTAYGYVGFDIASFYYTYSKAIQQPLLYFLVPETELTITSDGAHIKSIHSLENIRKILSVKYQQMDYKPVLLTVDQSDQELYERQVEKLVREICKGSLYKAIISRSVKLKGDLDTIGTYLLGAKKNNAVRSYCLRMGDVRAVGFSPEILMEVHPDGFIVTNPLAGTRPRSHDLNQDLELKKELFTDAKEVKEHAISIWLAQNEMLKLCKPQTVQIFDFMQVRQYSCVQHLSSRLGGYLKAENTLWDALKVLFPGVTVSGIHKHQALRWIDQLENEPRGLYAGGIGWINSQGAADLAIAIRSVYQYDEQIRLNAGAGIVAESVPKNEYVESLNKMNTMLSNVVLES